MFSDLYNVSYDVLTRTGWNHVDTTFTMDDRIDFEKNVLPACPDSYKNYRWAPRKEFEESA